MKTYFRYYLALFFLVPSVLYSTNHALIIAIGDYPEDGGWHWISSENDATHIQSALLRNQFKSEHIKELKNEEATYHGIISEFEDLLQKLKFGDVVFCHYSGHGQQVTDDNGDELDGLDEAIVPYDSPIDFTVGVYEGERLIRDDLIGEYLMKFRNKCGEEGQVVFIMDSCHSGTGTRGIGRSRGTSKIMAAEQIDNIVLEKQAMDYEETGVTSKLAPFISLFASSASELNFETIDHQDRGVGSLSYAVASILANADISKSFEEFFTEVKFKMKSIAPYQFPQCESEGKSIILKSGKKINSNISIIDQILEDGKLIAPFGTLDGVFEGSSVDILNQQREVLSTGIVVSTELTKSTVQISQSRSYNDEAVYVVPKKKTLPQIRQSVSIDLLENSPWSIHLTDLQKELNLVSNEKNSELFIQDCASDNLLQIFTKDGEILFETIYSDKKIGKNIYEIRKVIVAFTQGKYLRSVQSESDNLDFELVVNLVDCDTGKKLNNNELTEGNLKFEVGDCINVEVENIGSVAGYFSILDIQPNNMINLVIPAVELGYTSSEYFLKPGDRYETDYNLKIYEPYGEETFKLIASTVALDLSNILSTQGNTTRGSATDHVFEQILMTSFFKENTRGKPVTKPRSDELGIVTLFFEIIK